MGDSSRDAGRGSSDTADGDGGRTWSSVAQGTSGGLAWTSHKISEDEVEKLQGFFNRVLKLPSSMMDKAGRTAPSSSRTSARESRWTGWCGSSS